MAIREEIMPEGHTASPYKTPVFTLPWHTTPYELELVRRLFTKPPATVPPKDTAKDTDF